MKSKLGSGIATAAVFSALGVGALTYGLRAAPAAMQAIGALKKDAVPQGQGTVAAGAAPPGTGSPVSAQFAFLTTGSANAASGTAQTAAFKAGSGKFSGKREYAYYGYIKVQAVIENGQLSDVKVLEYPSDNGRSRYINQVALPYLIQEAVDAQSYKVDLITGATFTSVAFVRSLQEALKAAGA